ncbi:RluA family pseudouridine synthase [Labrys wisconsinensis]|uniref:tRNA pseudouridine32 synthase/23S rRNA pseudouridine746 synthase n=1 Tax=Labrys wisconsinensis TaxID=425677 RepID=A0ABU0JPG5_9HYPH|nr:RNA pseudouridine synthase [Labrys wisconsinensis]MDQ0475273.1 tRNA pseudouridine32 synthase/23S rRNA pseudouridine746 synthase [Labrys wisconsinensis]
MNDGLDIDLEARLLHRDGLMLVLDKPAGLPVHAGPKGGPNLTAMLDALRFGLPRRPELAHRLDKDTSGCLVLGRHPRALKTLNQLFARGEVEKTYWAVVEGGPADEAGRIDLALAPRSPERGWWMKPDPAGQPAATLYRVLGRAGGLALLELRPLTGRTHQLRVHCAASGFPILGDAVYGSAPRVGGEPLHLHARAVSVPLYPKKPPIAVEAPPPPHMRARLAALGWPSAGEAEATARP